MIDETRPPAPLDEDPARPPQMLAERGEFPLGGNTADGWQQVANAADQDPDGW